MLSELKPSISPLVRNSSPPLSERKLRGGMSIPIDIDSLTVQKGSAIDDLSSSPSSPAKFPRPLHAQSRRSFSSVNRRRSSASEKEESVSKSPQASRKGRSLAAARQDTSDSDSDSDYSRSGSESDYSSQSGSGSYRSDGAPRLSPMQRYVKGEDFCILDSRLANYGRQEINFAERFMPGLMALRERCGKTKPLQGARIVACLHVTAETAVLVETLVALGGQVRLAACNIFSTQDQAAAALVAGGVPVFAWKGETEIEFWWSLQKIVQKEGFIPNMLMDDGGDLTGFIQKNYPEVFKNLRGITEESDSGIHRLYQLASRGLLPVPAMNVNDTITKSKFDTFYGCRESVIEALKRGSGLMITGKTVVVCGYGDVGKGVAAACKAKGAHMVVTETDPICALQACMEGFKVIRLEDIVGVADVVITCTGNTSVITRSHIENMKPYCIIANMGHFDSELSEDIVQADDIEFKEVKPMLDEICLPSGKRVLLVADGRLLNVTLGGGHSPFVMSISFTNQVLAQMEIFGPNNSKYASGEVYLLPRQLDEEVARLHLAVFSARLTDLTDSQASFVGLNKKGPYKPTGYRY